MPFCYREVLSTHNQQWTRITPFWPALVFSGGVTLALLPFFVLCWYAHPVADDFLQANVVRAHGHWEYLTHMYFHWTGRYTASWCWSMLNPVSYGYPKTGYGLVCFLLLLAVPATLYTLLKALLWSVFPRWQLWLTSGALMLLFTFQLPSTAECFYWLTSAFNYLLPALLALLALTAACRYSSVATSSGRPWLIAAAILTVLAVGGNETMALMLLISWGLTATSISWQHRRTSRPYVALTILTATACAVALVAPGNFVRLAGNPQYYSLGQCVLFAVKTVAYYLINWLGNGVLVAVSVLLVPVSQALSKWPDLPLNRLARHPWLLTLAASIILVIGQVLAFWATGMESPPRVRNIQYLFFLLTWFLTAHGWIQYFLRVGAAAPLPIYVRWALMGWLLIAFLTDHNVGLRNPNWLSWRHNCNTTIVAYREWLDGSAARYDAQLNARYRYLQTTPSVDVYVPRLVKPPRTLLYCDITDNPQNWANRAYAEFFGKRNICLAAAPTLKP